MITTRLVTPLGSADHCCDPNREIGFGFVSCSCRACERAGEAKLRERVRDVSSQRWRLGWQDFLLLLLRPGFRLGTFYCYTQGFKEILPFGCYTQGF